MSLRILLAIIWLVPCLGWSQGLVGNGGEGILDQGEIFVRDLYERDLHLDPYFGTSISAAIQAEYKEPLSLGLTKEQNELLLRKLSDIEERRSCLGVLFARAIATYSWFLESEPLGLLPEEDVIRHFPDDRRVQLANRSVQSIRIHRGSWQKLSDESRVALIVHEIVYSLMRVEFSGKWQPGKGYYTQSLSMTREIVALFFTDAPKVGSQDAQQDLITREFGLGSGPLTCYGNVSPVQLTIVHQTSGLRGKGSIVHLQSPESIRSGVESFCRLLDRAGSEYGYDFQSTRVFPVELRFYRYQMLRQGQLGPLDVLEVYDPRLGPYKTCHPFRSGYELPGGMSCRQLLEQQVSEWLGPDAASRFNRCENE